MIMVIILAVLALIVSEALARIAVGHVHWWPATIPHRAADGGHHNRTSARAGWRNIADRLRAADAPDRLRRRHRRQRPGARCFTFDGKRSPGC